MVATVEEIGTAIEIVSISWQRGTTGVGPDGLYTDFEIYLGYCPSDMLTTEFADNYLPGSRTLVHQDLTQTISAAEDEWFTITLDSPFWYSAEHNLIMELVWTSGTGNPSVYEFNTPFTPVSLKSADPYGGSGFLSSMRNQFMLEGTESLEAGTFGSIKVLLGS